MGTPFNDDYINELAGELQNKLNEGLQHISNAFSGQTNPTCKTVLDEIIHPCWIPGKNAAKLKKTKIQIQLTMTRDEDEFLE